MRDDCECCGSDQWKPIYERGDSVAIVCCTDCGLTWNRAMAPAGEQSAYYASDYRTAYHVGLGQSNFGRSYLISMLTRAACLYEFIGEAVSPGARHLDIGCGEGTLLAMSRQRGLQTMGVELDARLTRFAKQQWGLTVLRGTLDRVALARGAFDVVSLVHVVEHLPNPVSTLKQVAPLLAEGGRLLIEVPNLFEPWQKPSSFFFRDHNYYFSARTLQRTVALAGFRPLRVAVSRRDGSVQLLAERRPTAIDDAWRDEPAAVAKSVLRNRLSYYAGLRFLRNKLSRRRLKQWAMATHGALLSPSHFDQLPVFTRAA